MFHDPPANFPVRCRHDEIDSAAGEAAPIFQQSNNILKQALITRARRSVKSGGFFEIGHKVERLYDFHAKRGPVLYDLRLPARETPIHRVIPSCIVFSWAAEYMQWPRRFAGTWKQYPTKVINQLTRMTFPSGVSLYLRCPYHKENSLTERDYQFFLNPGLRAAFDFSSGLQIVPGLSAPIGLGQSSGRRGVLVYLSFEHPLF